MIRGQGRLLATALLTLSLAGCASGPRFEGDHINTSLQPRTAVQAGASVQGETVVWGGRIIQVRPQQDQTTLEIVAFPLRNNQQPNTSQQTLGRFLMTYPGYLEPEDFREDRLITVTGPLEEGRTGMVGDASYDYPVVRATDFHLWPEQQAETRQEPSVRFGVGIGIFR